MDRRSGYRSLTCEMRPPIEPHRVHIIRRIDSTHGLTRLRATGWDRLRADVAGTGERDRAWDR